MMLLTIDFDRQTTTTQRAFQKQNTTISKHFCQTRQTQHFPSVTNGGTCFFTGRPRDQALTVREKCLRALKERLIERANIMQARFDEETASLNKLTANYNRDKDQMTMEHVHEYEQNCAGIKFRSPALS